METVAWHDAPARIAALARAAAERRAATRAPAPPPAGAIAVVGITGPMASGKSTLAALVGGLVISTDRYLPDYDGLPEHAWDLPSSSDLGRLAADLAALRDGRPARIPVWSFRSHGRTGEELVHPTPVVVVEGLHALHARVRGHLDVTVAVDAPRDERWRRCEERERRGERGWPLDQVRRFFAEVAEPTFDAHGRLDAQSAHLRVEAHAAPRAAG
jgi:uridine kinase